MRTNTVNYKMIGSSLVVVGEPYTNTPNPHISGFLVNNPDWDGVFDSKGYPIPSKEGVTKYDLGDCWLVINNSLLSTGLYQRNACFEPKENFTMMPQCMIDDGTMSLETKGLYAVLRSKASIPGFVLCKSSGRKCYSNGGKSFERIWRELKEYGYLKIFRIRSVSGKYHYEYELLMRPDTQSPVLTTSRLNQVMIDTETGTIYKDYVADPHGDEISDKEFELIENSIDFISSEDEDIELNSVVNGGELEEDNNISSDDTASLAEKFDDLFTEPPVNDLDDEESPDIKKHTLHFSVCEKSELESMLNDEPDFLAPYQVDLVNYVKFNIEYDHFKFLGDNYARNYIDGLLNAMLYVLRYKGDELKIGDMVIPTKEAQDKILAIDSGHIEFIIQSLKDNKHSIRNVRSYLIMTLLNAVDQMDVFITQELKEDGLL